MKTNPTDLDCEAATLFRPAPGMRAWFLHDGTPSRILNDGGMARWERGGCDFAVETSGPLGLDAIDTDDPATVGVMLAQVEQAARGDVELMRMTDLRTGCWWWFARRADTMDAIPDDADWLANDDCVSAGRAMSRAAALVAAMRALRHPLTGTPT